MTGSLPADLDQSAAEALEELSRDPKRFSLTNLTGGEGRTVWGLGFGKIGSIAQKPKSKRTEKPLLASKSPDTVKEFRRRRQKLRLWPCTAPG